ncbi:MAG: CBS domain-containing protein [Deltaproteobacteria bacterium]|nr:MAG: CBS domain-containing protein [Deltaproteobacteria bacterium]
MQERKDKWSVGAWMTPNPFSISPDDSVRSAFFRMRREGVRHLIVEEEGKLVGIVTDRDLRRPDITEEPDGWDDYYRLDEDYEVRYVMTTAVKTLRPGDPLEKALKLFLAHKFGAIPVIDKKGSVIGILSTHDALAAFAELLATEGERLHKGTKKP